MSSDATPRTGIDRRSALKKAAAAGAIAWTAPTIISSKAHAVDFLPGGCTAKCTPQLDVNLLLAVGQVLFLDCLAETVPGQQPVTVRITSFELAGGSTAACPCGGTPEIVAGSGGPIVGQEFTAILRPGNGLLTFEVPVSVTCIDRANDRISLSCSVQAVARVTGNCNSNAGNTVSVQFLSLGCSGTPTCTPA